MRISFLSMAFLPALAAAAAVGCKGGGGGGGGGDGGGSETGAPVAVISLSPGSGGVPLTVAFDGTDSSDPDGGSLAYSWDLGNGQQASSASGAVNYTAAGTFTVRLTVTDSESLSDIAEATVVVGSDESFAHQVLHLTNLERRAQSLPPLKGESHLDAAAYGHALDMAEGDYFAHDSEDGRSPWDRITAAGYAYSTAAENIAAGYATPAEVVTAWMNSAGHRANILGASSRELGVGYAYEADDVYPGPYGYHHYWVQDFGSRGGVYPVVIDDEAFSTDQAEVELYIYGSGWATEMMVSEDSGFDGAGWQAYTSTLNRDLSAGTGLKTVHVRQRNGATVVESSDSIYRL